MKNVAPNWAASAALANVPDELDEMQSIEVEIDIQDTDVMPGGKRVLVVFDQKVEAQGNRGIVGGPAAKMTATLISLDAKSWQISSILPKR